MINTVFSSISDFGALAVGVMFINILIHFAYGGFTAQKQSTTERKRHNRPIDNVPISEILNGTIYLTSVTVIINVSAYTFLEPTLANHLEDSFGMSISQVGIAFSVMGVVYAVFAPFIGSLSHRMGTKPTMMLGMFLCGVGCVLLVPFHGFLILLKVCKLYDMQCFMFLCSS
eukprot:TRINITY_DN2448_c0_g1_i1.p1 TRINITY_DN2448_c0_g1~~TRINITY_DN2448_c0_g1_i1.p1  ORF type:complete len:172 (-),score=13.16 TRINITY_DN2448_c0_g1_i1:402-917(-)